MNNNKDFPLNTKEDVDKFINTHRRWHNFKKLYLFTLKKREIKDNKELKEYFQKKISELGESIRQRNERGFTYAPKQTPVRLSNDKLREQGIHGSKPIYTPIGGQVRKRHH